MINLNPKDWLLAGLGLVVVGAGVWIMLLKANVETLNVSINEKSAVIEMQKLQIGSFVGAIDKQNIAIESLKVSTTEGMKEVAEKAKTVEKRYSTVTVKDATCESKLQAYEDMLKIFAGRTK